MRCLSALLLLALVGCGPTRNFALEFTTSPPGDSAQLARIDHVTVLVFDRARCSCAEINAGKAGCGEGDAVKSVLSQGNPHPTLGALPDGKVAVEVQPVDASGTAVALRLNCACVAGQGFQSLQFPLGTPFDPQGTECP